MKKQKDNFLGFKLSEIGKLTMVLFIVKPKLEHDLKVELGKMGGRVLLSCPAKGVSRKPILEMLGVVSVDMYVVFAIVREPDKHNIIFNIASKFEFEKPGIGKAFAVDIDGYLGAKYPFVEV